MRARVTRAVCLNEYLVALLGGEGPSFQAGFPGAPPCDGESLAAGANLAVHDLDGNARVNATDAVFILSYLFRAGPPPALGPGCVRIEGCRNACAR